MAMKLKNSVVLTVKHLSSAINIVIKQLHIKGELIVDQTCGFCQNKQVGRKNSNQESMINDGTFFCEKEGIIQFLIIGQNIYSMLLSSKTHGVFHIYYDNGFLPFPMR